MPRKMIGIGFGSFNQVFPDANPLGTISDLVAIAGVGQAHLAWTPAANAVTHQPQYSTNGGGNWTDYGAALDGEAAAIDILGLTTVEHTFRIVAVRGSEVAYSNTDTATPTSAPLTVGIASASPGDTIIYLNATAASGGVGAKTYQWYNSSGGVKGVAVPGATSLSFDVTGLTNGVPKSHILTVTDAAANSEDYAEVTATPAVVSSNEPVGATEIWSHVGDTTTPPLPWPQANAWWLHGSIPNPNAVPPAEVVADIDFTGGQALQLNFPETMVASGPQASWGNYGAEYSEMYIRYEFKLQAGWTWHSSGVNKQYYFGTVAGGSSACGFVVQGLGAATGRIKVFKQGAGAGTVDYKEASPGSIGKGTKHVVEVWVKAQSAPGVYDGEMKVWVDGVLTATDANNNGVYISHRTGIKWVDDAAASSKFNGFNWHAYWGGGASTTPKPADEWIRVGELYVSGIV